MCCFVMLYVFVLMFVVYLVLLNVVCLLRLGVCIVNLCSGLDGGCVFPFISDACSLRSSWSGSILVLSCRCCVFVSCMHCYSS